MIAIMFYAYPEYILSTYFIFRELERIFLTGYQTYAIWPNKKRVIKIHTEENQTQICLSNYKSL